MSTKLLPCPFCGVIPRATTSNYCHTMWSEWVDGKWVNRAGRGFVTEFKCNKDCLITGISGPHIYSDIDNRSKKTEDDVHEEAILKWNTRHK